MGESTLRNAIVNAFSVYGIRGAKDYRGWSEPLYYPNRCSAPRQVMSNWSRLSSSGDTAVEYCLPNVPISSCQYASGNLIFFTETCARCYFVKDVGRFYTRVRWRFSQA